VGRIEEASIEVDGVGIFHRRVPGDGLPTVFVHGNPTHSEQWVPFLDLTVGPAIALDLPGWGRSERPPGFDYTMQGLARFLDRFLETLQITDYRLTVHDWGGVALITAQRHPERVAGLVVINSVPLLPGYRWHWAARLWRRRGIGELLTATTTRAGLGLALRRATADRGPMPRDFVDAMWRHWDGGTRRAILQLYRSADPEALEAAGRMLGELRCRSLVVWGARDPFIDSEFGRLYAKRLPNAELLELPDAGHWVWIDRPDIVGRVVDFLESE
jgi:pimeloyl-ACP methyl ester carboxylesterase